MRRQLRSVAASVDSRRGLAGSRHGLLARAGVNPYLITQARAVNLLYQYWIHTETIGSLRHRELASGDAPIVDDPDEAVTAA